MLFQKPVIDVGKHIEMRYRRVFPISLEGSIRARYEEALKKLREATELERQAYQLTMERNILESRLTVWDWLGKNLAVLSESLTSGNYEQAKSLIQAIIQEAQRKYAEEQKLLQEVQSGKPVLSSGASVSTPSIVYIQPQQKTTQKTTSVSQTQQTQQTQNQQTQSQQVQQTQTQPPWQGVIKTTPTVQTPWYLTYPSVTAPPTQFSTSYTPIFGGTQTASSPANYPAFNPFQQSGFYNPFR